MKGWQMPSRYKVRYAVLPSRTIYNYVGPWDWQDSPRRRERRRYLFYRKSDWYLNLERDILENGFRNPICIVNEVPPNDYRGFPEYAKKNGLFCTWVGGSRLFWAQKHSLDIPCLISDFKEQFAGHPEIYNPGDFEPYVETLPCRIVFTKWGLDIRDMPGVEK